MNTCYKTMYLSNTYLSQKKYLKKLQKFTSINTSNFAKKIGIQIALHFSNFVKKTLTLFY